MTLMTAGGALAEAPDDVANAQAGQFVTDQEDVGVLDRPRNEYAALGLRAGQFLVFPRLELSTTYDDNVFARPGGGPDDAFLTAAPGVRVSSDWNQNAVSFTAGGVFQRYANHPVLDDEQYAVAANGTLNVRRDLTLTASASVDKTELARNADGYARDSTIPLYMEPVTTSLGLVKVFNRITLSDRFTYGHDVYTNGVTTAGAAEIETFRNHDVYGELIRADYAYTTNISFFFEEALSFNSYERSTLRTSSGTTTLIGSSFHLTHLMTGEVGVGYLTSDFHDRSASSVGNPTARVKVAYFVTPLITVTLNGRQDVVDSGIRQSPAFLSLQAGGRVDYEFRRNFIFSAAVNGAWNQYRVIDRNDRYYNSSLTASYLANRGLTLAVAASRIDHASSGTQAGPGSEETLATFSVTLKR